MNITNNRIDLTIPPADQVTIKQHIADASAVTPWLIGLEDDEKKGMVGINVQNKQFVEDCLIEMSSATGIMPAFIDPVKVKNDLVLFTQLEEVAIQLEDYLDKVRDSQYLAGAEAYAVCLIFYRLCEAAAKAGLPGADERYRRLKVRFEGQGGPGTPTPPAP